MGRFGLHGVHDSRVKAQDAGLGARLRGLEEKSGSRTFPGLMWEFPKIRGTLFGGPYNKDPTI